jgi:hypothetical protein
MKIANTLIMLSVLALSAETSVASSFDDYQKYRKGTYDFELETQYFKSEANYTTAGGTYQKLPTGQSFELIDFLIKARYDFSKRSGLYGNLDIATANSAGYDAKRSNSNLTGGKLGYSYLLYSDELEAISDLSLFVPMNQVSENTDTVMNTEGVIEATALLRLQKDYSGLAPFGYIGGSYRQNRSALLPWGAGLEVRWNDVTLGGKVYGFQSIMDDPDKSKASQRLVVNDRVNGGSLKFYAVNPAIVDSDVYVKFQIARSWAFTAGGGTTITGSADAAGFHAGANITYVWDSQPSYYLRPDTAPKFKEETDDGVDQKIFEKKSAPSTKPRPRSENLNPASEGLVVRRAAAPKPVPEASPEGKDAGGGEMQIKLKRKKRKTDS